MLKTNVVYKQDILTAIKQIHSYVSGISKQDFISNQMCQDAVIRRLEIIGEASNRINDQAKSEEIKTLLKRPVAMRNVLIYGYDQINLDMVWETIQNDLIKLQDDLENMLL